MRWASFGPTPTALVNALWSPLDLTSAITFRRHDGQDGQRGLKGLTPVTPVSLLKSSPALLLGSKAVERDTSFSVTFVIV